LTSRADSWHLWRGSLELLAQTARTLEQTVRQQDPSASFGIEVLVDGDVESFSSPAAFRENVTPEALSRFKQIAIQGMGNGLRAEIRYRWNRPWWVPGYGPDAQIDLEVEGDDAASVQGAFERLTTVVRRGGSDSDQRPYAVAALLAGLCAVGAAIAAYLLGYSEAVVLWTLFVSVWVFGLLTAALAAWLWIALEVAPPGRTNFARTLKFLFPLLLGLGIAGLTKKLYG
jgi:hypothetical protein